MCGICGEWNERGADRQRVERMNATLSHRGPDDEGSVLLGEAALAMRRLSIIDIEGGNQPIANEDESVWIVFNGEIYNHAALHRDLEARGHRFRTATDTEVLVHLYEEKGTDLVHDLRGMFAFAIWDVRRRRLVLGRDRFGQKPLFYALEPGRFLFGSEIKAVREGLDGELQLDVEALDDYLSLRCVPSPATMVRNIRKLPPAHVLTFEAGAASASARPAPEIRCYWKLSYGPKRAVDEEQALSSSGAVIPQTPSTAR